LKPIRTPLALSKLTRKHGDSISILTRKEVIDSDGRVVLTYPNTISTTALVYGASGLRESWMEVGYSKDIDYVVTILPSKGEFQAEEFFSDEFYTGDTISVGDLIVLSNTFKLEVMNVIDRGRGYRKDYLECLCIKRE